MPNPATEGEWSAAIKTPGDSVIGGDDKGVFVVHAVLLHTGKVMWWSGHAEDVTYLREVIVWDPLVLDGAGKPDRTKREVHVPPSVGGREIDPFCCFHVQLSDGRILTMGGAAPHPDHGTGIPDICIFDPTKPPGSSWTRLGAMAEGRWYPTAVHLPDDRILVVSGHAAPAAPYQIPFRIEVLSPPAFSASTVTETPAPPPPGRAFPTYPSMHLVAGDWIVHTGTTWRVEYAFGQVAQPVARLRMTGPSAMASETFGAAINNREEGTAVLLSPAQDGEILLLGGGRMPVGAHTHIPWVAGILSRGDFTLAGNPRSARVVEGLATPVSSHAVPNMTHPRINASAVLLVDGKVLVLGGHDYYKWSPEQAESLVCELFDPDTETWSLAAELHERRTYHSAALLLPDGSVIVAGGVNPTVTEPPRIGPPPAGPQRHEPDTALNIKTFEIYKPPYLFIAGARPTITAVRDEYDLADRVTYGRRFTVETPQAADIKTVVLMRPGAMTHHTDTEQRHIPLTIQGRTGNRLELTMLSDPSVAPPGFYMLFVTDNANRVCQRARFVHVAGTSAHGPPPPPPPPPPAPPINREKDICTSIVAFGSELHPNVAFLRRFRDDELSPRWARIVNRAYYTFSPALAGYLTDHPRARIAVRDGVLRPLVAVLRVVVFLRHLGKAGA